MENLNKIVKASEKKPKPKLKGEGESSVMKEIKVARHLDDDPQDNPEKYKGSNEVDLRIPGRDVGVLPGQEEEVKNIAQGFAEYAKRNGYKILVIPTSPKKRTIETAKLIKKYMSENKEYSDIKVIIDVDTNVDAMNQGKFILPEDYVPGDYFEGLKDAESIFNKEKSINPGYKFGDPVLLEDGSYKYPELLQSFKESGESYKDVLIRLYSQIIKLSDNLTRFGESKVGIAPVIHAQGYQIYYDLPRAAEMIKNGYEVKPGGLAELCWELYKTRTGENKMSTGESTSLSVKDITHKDVLEVVTKEIEYLKSI